MRKNSPSLVPRQSGNIVYIVLNNFGPKLGRAYCETDDAQADEATIIDNMVSGEYSCPVRVVAFNTDEGWSRDVSQDIARAVAERLQLGGRHIADNGIR
jgi:hypothetical protein